MHLSNKLHLPHSSLLSIIHPSHLQHALLLRAIRVIYDAACRLIILCADTEQIEYHLREIVRHEGAVNGAFNPLHLLRMSGGIARRDVYHEGDVELGAQGTRNVRLEVGATLLQTKIIHLLAVVREIEHDGVAVREHADDAVHHVVVVKRGVQIVSHHAALLVAEPQLALHAPHAELGEVSRMALAISGMLSVKMEDYEVALGSLNVVAVGTISVDELHVILVSARVVMIEEIRTDAGSVEESHRGVKLLVHLHASILIAVEHHVISAATEQEGEEWGVAPAAAVADSHGREKLLEVLRGAVV